MELQNWSESSFITLTYNAKNLPPDNSLHKDDVQKFIKRLRKDLSYENRSIKYFGCGEYGDKNSRPHYHLIIFGLGLSKEDRQLVKDNWRFCESFLFDGNHKGMGTVTQDSIQYVTGYVQKKYNGEKAKEVYGSRFPPFQVQSQGLGLNYFSQNYQQSFDDGFINHNGHKVPIPRYFKKKFEIDNTNQREFSVMNQYEKLLDNGYTREELTQISLSCHSAGGTSLLYNELVHNNLEQQGYNLETKLKLRTKKL